MTWKTACPVGADTNRTEQRTWNTACPVGADADRAEQRTWNTACPIGVDAGRTTCAAQADESEGFSYFPIMDACDPAA